MQEIGQRPKGFSAVPSERASYGDSVRYLVAATVRGDGGRKNVGSRRLPARLEDAVEAGAAGVNKYLGHDGRRQGLAVDAFKVGVADEQFFTEHGGLLASEGAVPDAFLKFVDKA